ncbi:YheV family putative zinc ribbon protein [Carnimonas nigrificans]|uniref:YheV family putative zinc ribbon protein n=1 Tax=Carnimonas nigrificans TaxID=64323 RepID=UPI00046E82E3|nr:YheV family putative zinc ribbon protein [Carnimonas nigrificans]
MTAKKRFIAGAVCPRCAAMDTLKAWEQNGIRYRECVDCDFFEQLPLEQQQGVEELETRVNKPAPAEPADELQTVRILDPGTITRH